jgi:hypothetical protein
MKDFLKSVPKSTIFWNALIFLAFIVLPFINLEIFLGFLTLIMTFSIVVGMSLILDEQDENSFIHFWLILSPFVWAIVLSAILVYLLSKMVSKFNKWLDNL